MTTTFFVSDTHFGHRNILKFEARNRPFASIEEHDEEMVRRWNAVVGPRDKVWHLGDVLMPKSAFPLLGRLNGHKHLVMGNHDHHPSKDYLKYFEEIRGCVKWRDGVVLTHVPIHPGQLAPRWRLNLHGHLHSRFVPDAEGRADPRYVNMSVEHWGLAPVAADDIPALAPERPLPAGI